MRRSKQTAVPRICRRVMAMTIMLLVVVASPGVAQNGPATTTIGGGLGLMYMPSAHTSGMGALTVGFKGLVQYRETHVQAYDAFQIVKDTTVLAALPIIFGLTDEVDLSAAVYGFGNARPLANLSDVTVGWGDLESGVGAARFGAKIRLPFDPVSPLQIAGVFGATIGTSDHQLDGLNYRWTRTATDVEASLVETIDILPTLSLSFQQGYVLSGSEYTDDQLVGAAGMQLRFRNRAVLNLEAVGRTFRGKGLASAIEAGADPARYDSPASVGDVAHLIDTATDYDRDFLVVIPSIALRLTSRVTLDLGAIVNIADQTDPKDTVQGVIGLTFSGGFAAMTDGDRDGISNRRDMEPDTPRGYPVDRYGISLDTDRDGVPDGIDQQSNTPAGARVNSLGVALDSDSDGVVDGLDMEPDTPRGMAVDSRGVTLDGDRDGVSDGLDREPNTPYGAIVDQSGVSLDGDGDGVPDGIDMEPDTIMGAVTNPQGVALDGDGDGVPDGIDMEPGTPRGITVDTAGRAVVRQEYSLLSEGMIRLNAIDFASASATISAESYTVLDEIGELLRKYPLLRIQIGGHTDSVGDKALNYRLSRERALAVRSYLLDHVPEIAPDRLQAVGYGSDKPVTTNATPEGRRQNRRVEFIVINRDELMNIQEGQ